MYCQACGAKNTDDARFCNMCGSSIAAAGTPGGPIAAATQLGVGLPGNADPKAQNVPLAHAATVQGPLLVAPGGGSAAAASAQSPAGRPPAAAAAAAPPKYDFAPHTAELQGPTGYLPSAMNNTMSVSLEAIGVRSSRRTWGAIALASVALMGLGALMMHFADRGDPAAQPTGGAAPDDPFIIGTPVPEGEELPGVDFVSGTNEEPGGSAGGTGGTGAVATATGAGGTGGAGSTGAGSMSASGGGAATGGTGGTGSTGATGSTGSSSSMSASGGGTGGTGGTGSTGGTGGTGGTGATDDPGTGAPDGTEDPAPGEDPPPGGDAEPGERDIEMDMYAGRVRFLIRRYYAARAQTCFDRATRVNPSLSGSVSIGMTIGPDGAVSAARVARNTTGDDSLGTCLQNEVRQWRLSPPPGGESVMMNLPFSR